MVELKGVMPAVTTPFKEDGSLDLPGFRKLIDTVIEDGAHNILINGCAGEAWALDTDEPSSRQLSIKRPAVFRSSPAAALSSLRMRLPTSDKPRGPGAMWL